LVRHCRRKHHPATAKTIIRDEAKLKPAPVAHRFAAKSLTFFSSREASDQVGNQEMN
jgi:hypothetical protein